MCHGSSCVQDQSATETCFADKDTQTVEGLPLVIERAVGTVVEDGVLRTDDECEEYLGVE